MAAAYPFFSAIATLIAIALMPSTPSCAADDFVRQMKGDKLIVFVHGFWGHPTATFTNDASGNYWPKLITDDPDLSAFDVLAIEHDSQANLSLEQISTTVRTKLLETLNIADYDQIFF